MATAPPAPAPALADVMAELEALGSEQTRKTMGRHGVTGPQFGVSYANLYAIQKRIKRNHALALDLWETDNHDARVLATLIADPAEAERTLPEWLKGMKDHVEAGAVATYVAKSPAALRLALAMKDDEDELRGTLAWSVLSSVAMQGADLPDDTFEPLIEQIEREIQGRKNRVRYAMLNTVTAIGTRSDSLKAKALTAAERIGKVHVDHGDTCCKTPNPLTEIEKAYAHRHRKR